MHIAVLQGKKKKVFIIFIRLTGVLSLEHRRSGGQQASTFSKLKTGKTGDRSMTILIQ